MLKVLIFAMLCHDVPISDGTMVPACHKEIVWQGEESMQVCNFAQAVIAQWKGAGKFASDEWTVQRYGCTIGGGQ